MAKQQNNNNNNNHNNDFMSDIITISRQQERELVKKRAKKLRKAFGPAIGSEEKFARAARKLVKMEIQRNRDEKFEMRHETFAEFYTRSKVCVQNACRKVGMFCGSMV